MSPTRKLGIRRTMTPNQVVAYNVVKARALRGWTQEEAAEHLAPYLGAKLSGPSFSALERSAVKVDRIKQFSADDLLALSRGFDLPIGYFFTPPPPAADAGLYAPDAGVKGLDPIVLLDAILGTPDNLDHWADELLAYSASHAPAPRSKREKPSVSPADLAQRLDPLIDLRAKALLRNALGDPDQASALLERLADALRAMDDTTPGDTADEAVRAGTARETTRGSTRTNTSRARTSAAKR
jgi:transcriptional regulator with XRE-family HTH domain